jgi:hypothetical protein
VTGSEIVSADSVASTCTASETGVTGSATFTNASVQTDSGDDAAGDVHPAVNEPVADNPAPNTGPVTGHIHVNGAQDNFHVVFNEQITNADGSLTVNAVHEFLDGPTAVGDLIIGQSVCGVTAAAGPTTTTAPGATTTTTPGATTTTTPGATTTTVVSVTTTAPVAATVPTSLPPSGQGALARTGSTLRPLAVFSLMSLWVGALLLVGFRYRSAWAGARGSTWSSPVSWLRGRRPPRGPGGVR